ncbi:MAG: DUF1836 domain-containing protein [Clostridium sp.]|jgi:hypothetical protein|uniref:DUF1836 domain-containing protein n=1 Tax=Clostridium sp. TaxID=1506 RepID=UPI0025C12936|nr:DUF1836 domain-containing protein [Clostridium sp.]MCH3966010.1 DUF1836 domain-containing protein [Clostridium sp.]MCI1715902.1 DUF1836 domain-containing protein [Clostridium sp.]MCI1800426.1 DUF1836 domain-containing protein [Clostridium sp.]MCI1814079.1 DUF1836 domain-containing protein [Clostridium sp.]MCI1870977.1 DUF1836 domain-containing protein [Clostridium sp.]
MDNNKLKKLLEELSSFEQLKPSSIPDIDLYMDQVTTFIDEKLGYLKRNEKDTALTKTMINNYTKAGILMPPNKKKYSKQHMILIVLIYYLKHILSINDIQRLFLPLVESINSGENHDEDLEYIYNSFLKIERKEMDEFIGNFEDKIHECTDYIDAEDTGLERGKRVDKDDVSSLIVIVIMLVVKANIEKRMAEKIIDEFF